MRFLIGLSFWHLKNSLEGAVDVSSTEISLKPCYLVKSGLICFLIVADAALACKQKLEFSPVTNYLKSRSKWEALNKQLECLSGQYDSVLHRTTSIDQKDVFIQLRWYYNFFICLHHAVFAFFILRGFHGLIPIFWVKIDPSRAKRLTDFRRFKIYFYRLEVRKHIECDCLLARRAIDSHSDWHSGFHCRVPEYQNEVLTRHFAFVNRRC